MAKHDAMRDAIRSQERQELIESNFKALQVPAKQLVTIIKNNMSGQIRPFDLDRVKVPAGGMTVWEVPSLKGPKAETVLEGIILHMKDQRSYWRSRTGGNQPPDCTSHDMLVGIGTGGKEGKGGDCHTCPFAQFGSAVGEDGEPGKGQACKHVKLLLFLRQDDMIPLLVSIPPTSVKPANKYFLRLAGAGLPYQAVTTQLRLAKKQSGGGKPYAEVEFALGRELREEEIGKALAISQALREVFEQASVVHADVNG